MANKNSSLPLIGPAPMPIGPKLSLISGTNSEQEDDSLKAIKIEHDDGSVTLDFTGKDEDEDDDEVGIHFDADYGKYLGKCSCIISCD